MWFWEGNEIGRFWGFINRTKDQLGMMLMSELRWGVNLAPSDYHEKVACLDDAI